MRESLPMQYSHLQLGDTLCVICGKVRKSMAGLKRHMVVHKEQISQQDPINPMKTLEFICHLCFKSCESTAGLKSLLCSHLKRDDEGQGRRC